MSLAKRVLDYVGDINYVTAQPSGLTHPFVVRGHFADDENGNYQRMFFDELLENGFHRTFWQLIFPGQTAGIVRKLDPPIDGMDEVHVRFYDDGAIAAELEYGRWSLGHWRERRESSVEVLETILDNELLETPSENKENIRSLFAVREYEPLNQAETGTYLLKKALCGGFAKAFLML